MIGLVVAAVGATLTGLATGGITSGLKGLWETVFGKAEPPLTVVARVEHSRRSSFVFEKRLTSLPTLPSNVSKDASRIGWARRNGGIDAGTTAVEVVVQGRSDASVVLLALSIEVLARGAPPTGLLIPAAGEGGIGVRYFTVNLDEPTPTARLGEQNERRLGDRQINFPYQVSVSEPEVFVIFGSTTRCDCRWIGKLRWTSNGHEGTTIIRDGDQPFRTASASAARDQLTVDQNGHVTLPS